MSNFFFDNFVKTSNLNGGEIRFASLANFIDGKKKPKSYYFGPNDLSREECGFSFKFIENNMQANIVHLDTLVGFLKGELKRIPKPRRFLGNRQNDRAAGIFPSRFQVGRSRGVERRLFRISQ